MRPATTAATLAVLVFVTAGCGAIAERATESAIGRMADGDVDLDISEGTFSVTGSDDGESFSLAADESVPDEIARVVPIPDGYRPASSFDTTQDGTRATNVSGTIDTEDPAGLIDELEGRLTTDGWERSAHVNQNDQMVSLGLTRGEETLMISIIADDGEGMLSFVYSRPAD